MQGALFRVRWQRLAEINTVSIQVDDLSTRHLSRVFFTETGRTIHQYQTELRMDRARSLLAGSRLSLERIAEQCGFGSVQALRACWNKEQAQSPIAMRHSIASKRVTRAK